VEDSGNDPRSSLEVASGRSSNETAAAWAAILKDAPGRVAADNDSISVPSATNREPCHGQP
jgi:hypothetical protein